MNRLSLGILLAFVVPSAAWGQALNAEDLVRSLAPPQKPLTRSPRGARPAPPPRPPRKRDAPLPGLPPPQKPLTRSLGGARPAPMTRQIVVEPGHEDQVL